ncbi:membrane hypothetical protein [Vibrio chagasii]|nr:membrane hypothetical protein [Vibrio chagasii]CAH7324230.1 membrane hypothetical protein [Vibrio chagasii]CAH7446378.1 membrane hypothetical protein [Vibrio chagasii]CAH7460347.1 membrane hypothetical protein [Vibrio chagasii]
MSFLFSNKYKYRNLYVASGGDDFLTTSAKIHKRNLMYSALLCIVISIIGYDKTFDSIFGFKISDDNGIPSVSIITILVTICFYELISLCSYFKLCRSLWLWRDVNSDKKEGDVINNKSISESLKIGLFMYDADAKKLERFITRITSESLSTYRIYKKIQENTNKYVVYSKDDGYGFAVDKDKINESEIILNQILDAIKSGDNEGAIKGLVNDKIEKYINHRIAHDQLIQDVDNNIINLKSEIEKELKSIQTFLTRLNNSTDKLIYQFENIQAGYKRYIIMDFIVPSSFGLVAILIGFLSIYNSNLSIIDVIPDYISNYYEHIINKTAEVFELSV